MHAYLGEARGYHAVETGWAWRAPDWMPQLSVRYLGEDSVCPIMIGGSGLSPRRMWHWAPVDMCGGAAQWVPWGNMPYRAHRFFQHARVDSETRAFFLQQPHWVQALVIERGPVGMLEDSRLVILDRIRAVIAMAGYHPPPGLDGVPTASACRWLSFLRRHGPEEPSVARAIRGSTAALQGLADVLGRHAGDPPPVPDMDDAMRSARALSRVVGVPLEAVLEILGLGNAVRNLGVRAVSEFDPDEWQAESSDALGLQHSVPQPLWVDEVPDEVRMPDPVHIPVPEPPSADVEGMFSARLRGHSPAVPGTPASVPSPVQMEQPAQQGQPVQRHSPEDWLNEGK